MKKLLIIIGILLSLTSIFLIIFFSVSETSKEEVCYSVRENRSYLSKDDLTINIKVYDNLSDSLLLYSKESEAKLHDKNEENVISVKVEDVYISSVTTYNDETFYEYNIKVSLNINYIYIEDCYLTLTFTNNVYSFNIGNLQIHENNYIENELKITNLYGISSVNDLTLKALIITIKNDNNYDIDIKNMFVGSDLNVILNDKNIVEIKDDLYIENYECSMNNNGYIRVKAKEEKTFIIPIINNTNLHLSNIFLTFDIKGESYYLSNFTYIKTNDLDSLKPYLFKGIKYGI